MFLVFCNSRHDNSPSSCVLSVLSVAAIIKPSSNYEHFSMPSVFLSPHAQTKGPCPQHMLLHTAATSAATAQRRSSRCTAPLCQRQFRKQIGLNIFVIRNAGVRLPTRDGCGGGTINISRYEDIVAPTSGQTRGNTLSILLQQGGAMLFNLGNTLTQN